MDKDLQHRLKKTLAQLAPGTFHFSEIYGPEWSTLYIGDRVKLGNEFLRKVRGGEFAGVTDTGRKKGGGRVYLKER